MQVIDPASLERRLERVAAGQAESVVDQLLAHRQPIHLGGMSDPFLRQEKSRRATLRVLEILADHDYPTLVSTKSVLPSLSRYRHALARGRFILQYSVSSLDDRLLAKIDHQTPAPSKRIATMSRLAADGVPVSCRIQPLLPGREDDALAVIAAAAAAGAQHVGVEHLKLPVERAWSRRETMSSALGLDLLAHFHRAGAERIGREWILPVGKRLGRMLEFRRYTKSVGLSFAAADNDLLLLSDGSCCCSGADRVPGFEHYFRFTYHEAARRGLKTNRVAYANLAGVWRPRGTISRHINSHSRLPARGGQGAGIEDYLVANWNGRANGCSPRLFHGVQPAGQLDGDGREIYRFAPEVRRLYLGGSGGG